MKKVLSLGGAMVIVFPDRWPLNELISKVLGVGANADKVDRVVSLNESDPSKLRLGFES